jgi:diguanylate cyclase (GGDEF)-like protein
MCEFLPSCHIHTIERYMRIFPVLLGLLLSLDVWSVTPEPMKIGVLAIRGNDQAVKQWSPLAQYLSESIPGYNFKIIPQTIDSIKLAAMNKEVDFVLTNPASFVTLVSYSKSSLSHIATLRNRREMGGFTEFGAIIFTRSDRDDIQTLSDLKNKSFMAVHENAFGGWWMALREMRSYGIDEHRDFSRLEFAGFPQDKIVNAVLNGDIDAGTVRTDVLESMADKGLINANDFKVINAQPMTPSFPFARSTRLYPEWPFAVLNHVPGEVASQVVIALLQMPPNSNIAKASKTAGWTVPLDYGSVHGLLKELSIGAYEYDGHKYLNQFLSQYWYIAALITTGIIVMFFTLMFNIRKKIGLEVSRIDNLTGTSSLSEFERQLQIILDDDTLAEKKHALLYMDLDQFKIVNDSCGHSAGDELLKQVSKLIKQSTRSSDILSRVGGDEFGVLLKNCPLESAMDIAEKMRGLIEKFQFHWGDQAYSVGLSIGVMPINNASKNLEDIMRSANAACYVAKDMGKNRIHLVQENDDAIARVEGDILWINRIREALKENRFCLHYQTILPISGSKETHCELLLRMIGEDGKLIPPGNFFPAAERYNLAWELDRWVISTALGSYGIKNFIDANDISKVSINLSGQSIGVEEFLSFLVDQLNRSEIEPEKICFEITETVAISNMQQAQKLISVIKDMGCYFALDDFGSGMSSYGYLSSLHVDYLKIDGSLVRDMSTNSVNAAMVESINNIGHVMGMQTIAEFVEDDRCLQDLKVLGVDFAQGYAINKPQPIIIEVKKQLINNN